MTERKQKAPRKPGNGGTVLPDSPGRPKGVPNKFTGELKEMILRALEGAGGAAYLQQQALDNPAAFMSLLGKVLPMTIATDPKNPPSFNTVITVVSANGLGKPDHKGA